MIVYGVLSDVHVPFHNMAALRAALELVNYMGGKKLILNGDFADMYNISRFAKNPGIKKTFLDEIDILNSQLDEFERFGFEVTYLAGNHEDRLERFTHEHSSLYGLLGLDKLLKFESRIRFQWIPYEPMQSYRLGKTEIYCRHHPSSGGKYPAAHTAEKTNRCFITGHVHRAQSYWHQTFNGPVRCFSSPFLGDLETGVFDYVKGHFTWQTGFILVTEDNDGNAQVDIIPWLKDRYIYAGKVFK